MKDFDKRIVLAESFRDRPEHRPVAESPPFVPWYRTAVRIVLIVPAYLALAVFCACLLVGWGPETAAKCWKENS